MKEPILNLTNEGLPNSYTFLLSHRPKFVPTDNKVPAMDIITSTESFALELERKGKLTEAETIRQNVSRILKNNLKLKIKDNLSTEKRKALKEIKNDNNKKYIPLIKVPDLQF